jgi:hypothetical protein
MTRLKASCAKSHTTRVLHSVASAGQTWAGDTQRSDGAG